MIQPATNIPEECPVCVTSLHTLNKSITCPHCKFIACETCYMQYIADHPSQKAQCMEPCCQYEFPREFLCGHFKHTYLTHDYQNHLNELFTQIEMSKLPQTQEKIILKETHAKRQALLKELAFKNPLDHSLLYLSLFYQLIAKSGRYADESTEPKNIQSLEELQTVVAFYDYEEAKAGVAQPKEYAHQFRGKCPATNCRGLLSLPDYQCGMCLLQVCPDCHVPLPIQTESPPHTSLTRRMGPEPHICDLSVVESIKLIAQETKPCPSCHVPIYKTEGCAHMWCVQCHTAFSWKTGKPVQKFHNPHHVEWIESQRTVTAEDNRSFGEWFESSLKPKLQEIYGAQMLPQETFDPMMHLYSGLCHGLAFHSQFFRPNEIGNRRLHTETEKLRESYLRNSLSLSEFKNQIGQVYKYSEYTNALHDILVVRYIQIIRQVTQTFFQKLNHTPATNCLPLLSKFHQKIERSIRVTETALKRCALVYNTSRFFKFIYTTGQEVRLGVFIETNPGQLSFIEGPRGSFFLDEVNSLKFD
jgi:hypothetical protein